MALVSAMEEDPTKIWISLEAYDLFSQNLKSQEQDPFQLPAPESTTMRENDMSKLARLRGDFSSRNLKNHYGRVLLVLKIHGCASILCFREHVPDLLKLVAADDSNPVTEVVKLISSEMQEKRVHVNYDFWSFHSTESTR